MEQDITQPGAGVSRRGLVRGATGVAAVGAVALAASRTPAQAATGGPDMSGSAMQMAQATQMTQTMSMPMGADDTMGTEIVVHVRDVRTGELDIFRGTTHRRVYDRELAARLLAAAA